MGVAACVVFLTTMAFMPIVETGDPLSNAVGPSRLIEIGLLLIAGGGLVVAVILQRCPLSLRSPAALIVLVYACWALASSLWSVSPILSLRKGLELMLTQFIAIGVVVYLKNVGGLSQRKVASTVALGVVMAIASLLLSNMIIAGSPLQFGEPNTWTGRQGRFHFGESDPLETAELLMLGVIAARSAWRSVHARTAIVGGLLVLLLLTNGRTMMLLFPVVIAATMFNRSSVRVRATLGVVGASTLAILIVFSVSGDLTTMLPDEVWALNGRVPLWAEAVHLIGETPMAGIGYFASRTYLLDRFDFGGHAHNSYVEATLTTGVVGLGLMLIPLVYATILAVRSHNTFLLEILLLCYLGSLVNPVILVPNVTTFIFTLVLVATAEQTAAAHPELVPLEIETRPAIAASRLYRPGLP